MPKSTEVLFQNFRSTPRSSVNIWEHPCCRKYMSALNLSATKPLFSHVVVLHLKEKSLEIKVFKMLNIHQS